MDFLNIGSENMSFESNKLSSADLLKEEVKFLEGDFNQCFSQMRHYDGQIIDLCKFAFTAYSAIVGLAFALYRYGISEKADYSRPAVATLIVGLCFGFCFVAFMVRNRTYFVIVARYVNEHRRHFLQNRPLGFANHSKMYVNLDQPPYFHWRSSQSLLLYVMSGLNGFLAGAALHLFRYSAAPHWRVVCILGVGIALVQILWSSLYLRSREGKSSGKAVFGNREAL